MSGLMNKIFKKIPGLSPKYPGSKQFTGRDPAVDREPTPQVQDETRRRGPGSRGGLGGVRTPLSVR